jgi:hypothetical protein
LHILNGNPSRKKLNENEVRPPAGEITKPATLSMAGGLVWDELAPVCLAMGTLTTADVKAFATACELQATFTAAAGFKGTPEFDARLERETAAALRPYYELFGLTPVARARISVPKAEKPVSKWAGMGIGSA